MRSAWLILCLIAIVPAIEGGTGEEYAFIEMETPRDTYFVQEPIRLRMRIGFDRRFFQSNVIQLFRRRLDVPVQLQAEWLEDLPTTVALESEAVEAGERLSFSLNDGVAQAVRVEDRVMDNRPFTVLEMERSYLPLRPGELVIPEPMLRFAFATRFQEDLFGGRVAEDRHDATVSGERLVLEILPVPEEERPSDFFGAVGHFSIQADAEPLDVAVGEILKLKLRIEGEGNFGFFDPPRLDGFEGFHVYGSIEEQGGMHLVVTYDLVPLSEEVREVPTIPFAFFDTRQPAGFRIVRTRPILLEVHPLREDGRLDFLKGGEAAGAIPGENDIFGLKPAAAMPSKASRRLPPILIVFVILVPWILAFGLLVRLRALERDRRDPDGARARRAAAVFRTRAARQDTDPAESFVQYLAARLRCPDAAVIDPELESRLLAAGISADSANRAASLLEGLVDGRYGGGAPPGGAEAARALVEELEASFRNQGRDK